MSESKEEEKLDRISSESLHSEKQTPSTKFSKLDPFMKDLAGKIFQCIETSNLVNLETLLSSFPDANITELYNINGFNLIQFASMKNDHETIELLLSTVSKFWHIMYRQKSSPLT